MKHWFRRVLPSDRVIGMFVFTYLIAYGLFGLSYWLTGGEIVTPFLAIRDLVLVTAAIMYGAFRVAAFHPLCRREYNAWLQRTPWTIRKPLPAGPVQLVPQDALMLLVLYLLAAHRPYFEPERLVLCFLFAYLVQVSLTYWLVGLSGYSYALAFGLGLVLRLWDNWPVALAVSAVLYPIALSGLRETFLRFPWTYSKSSRKIIESTEDALEKLHPTRQRNHDRPQEFLGWPFDRLSPQVAGVGISYGHGILLSLLFGWWVYVIVAILSEMVGWQPDFYSITWVAGAASVTLAFARLTTYCHCHNPPISLWGRILTFRWIIPGYDQVLVAPLSAVALSATAATFLFYSEVLPPDVSVAVPPTLAMLVILNAGPTLETWHLTGAHRIVRGYNNQSKERTELVEI